MNGTLKAFFVVQNGQTYIDSAFIADGTITNAMIGNVIQSNNYNGTDGWQINKDGSAYFGSSVVVKGDISATTITGAFQAAASISWSGSLSSDDSAVTPTFVCPEPLRSGEQHKPQLNLAMTFTTQGGNDATSCNVFLDRLDGSTWTQIDEFTPSLGKFQSQSLAYVFLDQYATAATSYRFRMAPADNQEIVLTQIRGSIIGQRV